jgi:hypothetical protein
MTRTAIRNFFNRNKPSGEIDRALTLLQEQGRVRMECGREQEEQKKPTERWFAVQG